MSRRRRRRKKKSSGPGLDVVNVVLAGLNLWLYLEYDNTFNLVATIICGLAVLYSIIKDHR